MSASPATGSWRSAVRARAAEEVDASGKLVTPSFVDPHTHYDAQVTWANHITPSSCNGVTTALLGNCGVGFAPCLPHQRDMLVKLMEGVEDIPEPVLTEGLPWNWQSFPDYLDRLDARRFDLDIATQVPHAALRVFVMGERGAAREPATEADRTEMARLAAEGIRAGALGFSTSRTLNHKTVDGTPTPTLDAAEAELSAIARAIGETNAGWLQVISDFDEAIEEEFAMLRRLVAVSGRPMTTTVLERDSKPREWHRLLELIAEANAGGQSMTGMVLTRPTGIMGRWVAEIIKRSDTAKGFVVLPRRWVVERTIAWLGRCRRLAKDFELTVSSATAWVLMAHIRLLTRRLARTFSA